MSVKLSDILKSQRSMRLQREGSIKDQSKIYAAMLQAKAEEKKREKELEEERRQQQIAEAEALEQERLRIERENKTKRYFTFNKYNRKVPAPRKPVYYGEMVFRSVSWMPHGQGQYLIDGDRVKMEGSFQRGNLIHGVVNYEDGVTWEGSLKDNLMEGVGTLLIPTDDMNEEEEQINEDDSDYDAEEIEKEKQLRWEQRMNQRIKRHVIMHANQIVCFRDELTNGKRIEFLQSVFGIHSQHGTNRHVQATIVSHIRNWIFCCRFDDEVWPRDKNIDLSVHHNFRLLNKAPMVYTLTGFGYNSETRRVYDHRHQDTTDRYSIRDSAENLLKIQRESADEWELRKSRRNSASFSFDSRSFAGTEPGIDLYESAENRSYASFNSNIDYKSLESNQLVRYGIDNDNVSIRSNVSNQQGSLLAGNNYKTSQSIDLASRSIGSIGSNASYSSYTGNFHNYHDTKAMRRRRLMENFPMRAHEDYAESFFEGEAIGVGAAAAEQARALQNELKKQQFKELIEERRKIQEEQRQKQIEEEQQRLLSESVSQKRQSDKLQREENEAFEEAKRKAISEAVTRLESR